jgi:hypothetical protein
MSHHLPLPGEELSRRLLRTVPYKDRLSAGRLMPPVGMLRADVRSLRELHLLLAPDDRSLPGVNLSGLADWVERVIGDGELAEALRKTAENPGSYVDRCLKVYELVGLRLTQARKVVEPEVAT